MNLITNEMVHLSLFFYAVGFGILAVAGFKKSMITWIIMYGLVAGTIILITETKWFLMGGIVFMLLNQFYVAWNINQRVNQCIAHIKAANDAKKIGINHGTA